MGLSSEPVTWDNDALKINRSLLLRPLSILLQAPDQHEPPDDLELSSPAAAEQP